MLSRFLSVCHTVFDYYLVISCTFVLRKCLVILCYCFLKWIRKGSGITKWNHTFSHLGYDSCSRTLTNGTDCSETRWHSAHTPFHCVTWLLLVYFLLLTGGICFCWGTYDHKPQRLQWNNLVLSQTSVTRKWLTWSQIPCRSCHSFSEESTFSFSWHSVHLSDHLLSDWIYDIIGW